MDEQKTVACVYQFAPVLDLRTQYFNLAAVEVATPSVASDEEPGTRKAQELAH